MSQARREEEAAASEPSPTVEALVEEFLARRRRGEPVGASAFASSHPALESELRDALEAAEAMEGARSESEGRREFGRDDRVGKFRLVREVGRGGMGVVFEAIEEPLGRRVALKLLPADQLVSHSAHARFRREAELASRLDHSGICTVYAAGVESDRPWIAMRFVEGETLSRAIVLARERGEGWITLPGGAASGGSRARSIAAFFARIARSLAYAHEHGVVHRDVKPSNVMVTPSGEPILLDFGLAREEESDAPSLTRTGETAGTPAYIAPELLGGELARPDARCDVYSLGVSLYECLALRQPFRAPTRLALFRAILAGTAPNLRQLVPELSRDMAVVVSTAMERDRERRYASAADLAADLEALVAGRPIAARPVSNVGRALRWAKREPRQAVLAALLTTVSLGLALAGGFLWASRDDVLAAERQSRAEEVEQTIVAGFNLLSDDLHGIAGAAEAADAEFSHALALEPASVEAHAGAILVSYHRSRREEGLERLGQAPPLPVFDRLRLVFDGGPMLSGESWRTEASAIELFIEGMRYQIEAAKLRSPAERTLLGGHALELLNEAVIRAPAARAVYHMLRASAAVDAGDANAARSAAAALLNLWPDSPRELYLAGMALTQTDPETACGILERVIALDPHHFPAFHNLGSAHILLGEPEAAEQAFLKAIELLPDHAHPYNGLGLALADQGRVDEAREAYLHALDLEPDFVEALSNLGNLEAISEDWPAAVEALAHALELDPMDLVRRSDYAAALLASGSAAEALNVAERGLEFHPGDAGLRSVQAEARQALGIED